MGLQIESANFERRWQRRKLSWTLLMIEEKLGIGKDFLWLPVVWVASTSAISVVFIFLSDPGPNIVDPGQQLLLTN